MYTKSTLLTILLCTVTPATVISTPRITALIVIDQFPLRYLQELRSLLKDGFKTLQQNGVSFINAMQPHGMPATCTGHTALNTGAYAQEHGIVGNAWFDAQGTRIACDDDTVDQSPVLNPQGGTYTYGKSSHWIMVDGISDQFVLSSTADIPRHAYSVGVKSRATIATSNKMGKPIWFDTDSGEFTSSKAYFEAIPDWLAQFNSTHRVPLNSTVTWKQYAANEIYRGRYTNDYRFIGRGTLVGTTIPIEKSAETENPYELFLLTPIANQLVLDCARTVIAQHIHADNNDELIIWVCLGSMDKLGHMYGPWSKEAQDMILWLDKQIGTFITELQDTYGADQLLTVLTSDHGAPVIPEQYAEMGFPLSRRLNATKLIQSLNQELSHEFGISKPILGVKGNNLYLNTGTIDEAAGDQEAILLSAKKILEAQPGIRKAWTLAELRAYNGPQATVPARLYRQLFTGRSGDLIIQVEPYTLLTAHTNGIGHNTPYNYNTQVPLIFYWPGMLPPRRIGKRVTTTQLAPTLSEILQIQQPSSSFDDALPYIIDALQDVKE